MAVSVCGLFMLVSHLAGQIREGSASEWSLLTGVGCFLTGLICTLLFSILIRLDRIERQLSQTTTGSAHDEEDLRPEDMITDHRDD